MALIGYARVSTLEQQFQVQHGELQAAGCIVIFEEKASGGKRDRPVLRKMLASVQSGDTIVVVRMDRLARSLVDLLGILDQLRAKGVGFRSLRDPIDTTTPHGLFQLQIMGAVAEFERRLIRDRVISGLAVARAQGRLGGNPKVRARDPVALEALQEARKAAFLARVSAHADTWVPIVRKLRSQGEPWSVVVQTLNAEQPADREAWTISSLTRALKRLVQEGKADEALLKKVPLRHSNGKGADYAAHVIAGIRQSNSGITLSGIAKQLQAMGIKTSRGQSVWALSSIQRLANRPKSR